MFRFCFPSQFPRLFLRNLSSLVVDPFDPAFFGGRKSHSLRDRRSASRHLHRLVVCVRCTGRFERCRGGVFRWKWEPDFRDVKGKKSEWLEKNMENIFHVNLNDLDSFVNHTTLASLRKFKGAKAGGETVHILKHQIETPQNQWCLMDVFKLTKSNELNFYFFLGEISIISIVQFR